MNDAIEATEAAGIDDLMKVASDLGFGRMLLSVEPPVWDTMKPQVLPYCLVSHGWQRDYVASYVSNISDDPFRRRAVRMDIAKSTLPIVWEIRDQTVLVGVDLTCSSREIGLLRSATAMGVATGVSTQILTAFGSSVFLNFYSALPREDAIHSSEVIERLFLISHEIQHRLSDMCRRRTRETVHLSPREIECLEWSVQGKNSTEIAGILALSTGTVREYLKSAAVKLDAASRTQAVARAIGMGLLH